MSRECTRCGLSADYPGADLDGSGLCTLCRAAGDRAWPTKGEEPLRSLIASRANESAYACLVSYSGGKDSTYMLARLAKWFPGRVLAYTFDTRVMSEHVWDNIRRVVDRLGVTWLRFSPPAGLMKRVFAGSLEQLIPLRKKSIYARGTVEFGPLCYACGTLYHLMAVRTAALYEVPFVAVGFTPAQDSTHYPLTHKFRSAPAELHADVHEAREAGMPAGEYLKMAEPMLRLLETILSESEVRPFRTPRSDSLERLRILRFYDYVRYDETMTRERSVEVGFEPPPDTGYGSTNCVLNPLIRYVYARMFEADKYLAQDAALIRWGFGRRDEVLGRATPLPKLHEVKALFDRIGVSPDDFHAWLAESEE